jgi:thiamine-phosphate pyrophosphorylase
MSGTDSGRSRRARLRNARLYLICDARPRGGELAPFLRAAVRGGVDAVQLRDKRLGQRELAEAAASAAAICRDLGALFIVNDDAAAAVAAGADGVHVGQADMPLGEVRALVGPELLVGISTHTRKEIDAAAALEVGGRRAADYLGVGPVFETPTQPGRAAVGVELVRHAAAHASAPFFAIGGIGAGNVRTVLSAGARRVAVVRAIGNAESPERAARALREELEREVVERSYRSAAAA